MIRRYSLLATLAAMFTLAHGQTANPAQPGMPPAATAPATNVYVIGGFYGTGVYSVPSGGLLPPAGTVGISAAGQTGISMSTPIETPLQSTLGPRPVTYGTPSYYAAPAYPPAYSAEATAAAVPAAETSGRLINDMAPSYAGGAPVSAAPPTSLGEVAAQYKTNRAPASARTYTNADAERLGNRITVAGASVSVNAAPTAPLTPVETAKVQPPEQPAPPAETPSTAPPVTQQPPPEQPGERQSSSQLPATSTFLPLLGLAGLLSGGIGLLVRRLSK